jgi:hypothetical protein
MMLGGVGFQAGLDEARRARIDKQRQAAVRAAPTPAASGVVTQLTDLTALLDDGVLRPQEFGIAKRKMLG